MTTATTTMGFIGAGNMAEAFIGAIIKSDICKPSNIFISDIDPERVDIITNRYRVQSAADNFYLFSRSNFIVLAVKPQHLPEVLADIASRDDYRISAHKLILSIAAGFPIRKIESVLYKPLDAMSRKQLPIIRVMPNIPALALAGMSGMSPNEHTTDNDLFLAKSVLNTIGKVIELKEDDLDAVTAVSGTGPAYVCYLMEAMIQAGIDLGLSAQDARRISLQTVKGTACLLQATNESPETLRQKVTSAKGTTEAAVKVLDHHEVKHRFIDAVKAAALRSRELSE